jgi:antitoxin CptB
VSEAGKARQTGRRLDLKESAVRLKKLKWLCRRGMKELDVLLQRFLTENEQQLVEGAFPEFEALLGSEDDRIWAWVQHPDLPDAGRYGKLLGIIRNGAAHIH